MRAHRPAFIVVALLLLAACGSDDADSGDTTAAAANTTAAAGATTAPATTSAGSAGTTGGSTATSAPATTASGASGDACTDDRVGGDVTMGMFTQPAAFDPAKGTASSATGGIELLQFYDSLMAFNPDTGEFTPRVAESLEPDATFQTWTLKLRPGVTFGNGDVLDAAAVKASIERFIAMSTGPYKAVASQITSMEVPDASTVVFTLNGPWAGFPFTLANAPGMIVDTKVADAAGDAFGANPTGAGVGAFEFVSQSANENLVLARKDDWWGGPVCLDTLTFVPIPADQARYETFQTGGFQAAYLRDSQVVANSETDGVPGLQTFTNANNVVLFNAGVSTSPANDPAVRLAVAHLINQQDIADRVAAGTGNPTNAVLGENSLYYDGLEGPALDPAAAADLIAEAKGRGWDGKLRLVCAAASDPTAIAIEAELEAAGIDVDRISVPDASALVDNVIIKKDFDMSCWGLNILDEALWPLINNSLNSANIGTTNYGGYSDAGVDAALADLRTAADPDAVKAAMATIQERWNENVPAVVLNAGPVRIIHTDELKGIEGSSNALVFMSGAYVDG